MAVDTEGKLAAEASSGYPLYTPKPGWTEQSPEDWWHAAKEALSHVADKVREAGGEIAGLGLTGQMHGAVFLDAAGEVIRPALLWNDQRTAAQCEWITERVTEERLLSVVGNPALTGFQAPKVLWLRDEEPENYSRLAKVLLPKDYIRYRLTGEYATDASDASGTLLLDVGERDWSAEVLDALGLPAGWFPEVYEGPETTGEVGRRAAAETGLPAGIPVAAGGGDNAAAAVGTGIVSQGLVSSSVGTSGVVFAHASRFDPDPSGRLHAFCHAVPGAYHLMGVTLSAGASLEWWAGVCGAEIGELVREAEEVVPGAEGLLFMPYLSGERTPHLDPESRGGFVGLTAGHGRAQMTRAVMEGVIFSLEQSLRIMRALGVETTEIRAIGGGGRSALWRKMQADIYGLPVYRMAVEEGPAYGAALLAGVAAGVYGDVGEASSRAAVGGEATAPDPESQKHYAEYFALYETLYPRTKDASHRLGKLARRQTTQTAGDRGKE